ncbi:MAG: protein kinase [Myxococcales bacterium]|nr:protein kinase [Myxococcales bacterium]
MRTCRHCGATSPGDADRFCAACGTSLQSDRPSSADDPFIGRTIGGSYTLQQVVGVGGMGRVYRAEQGTLGRTVAVKVIHPHLLSDEQTVARFYQEARAASRLNHPNSVSIIDFGRTDDGVLFLVMEFLKGRDLALVMRDDGPLPFARICDLLMATLDALGEAHLHDIVHRDLKPENVIVGRTRTGRDTVRVVDFGLATIVGGGDSSITTPGMVCGTPDYMSPEQGRGELVDGRGDIYAAGVMLFELLTERLPYIDDTPTKVVLKHINAAVPDPREVTPYRGIPPALAEITMRALAKDPAERFQSAEAMRDALRAARESMAATADGFQVCTACGEVSPPRQKFCGECGAALPVRGSARPRRTSLRPSFYPVTAQVHPFVGRDLEMAQLEEYRDAATDAVVRVLIDGEVGAGKTRLLTEAAEAFRDAGDLIVGAAPHPSGAPVPYGAISELLCGLLDTQRDGLSALARAGTFGSPLALAGLTEVLRPEGLRGTDGESRAGAVAAALATAVATARERAPTARVVIIVDDLYACDGLSVEVVEALPRLLAGFSVLLLTADVHHEVAPPGAHSIRLSGLEPHDAVQFLAVATYDPFPTQARAPESLASQRFAPLYLEQVHALGGRLDDDSLPTRLADAVLMRVERMSIRAQRALQAASVLGRRCQVSDLRKLVAGDDWEGVAEAAREGLLEMTDVDVEVAHPFVANLVEASIPAEARKQLHDRAFTLFVEANAPLAVQAEHAYRAGESIRALMVLERLGELAMEQGDPTAAALAFRRGLESARRAMLEAGDTLMDPAIVSFSRKLGEALDRSGDRSGAEGVLREAMDLTAPRSVDRAKMLLALGAVLIHRGRAREALRQLGMALELLAGEDEPGLVARITFYIGRARRADGDLSQSAASYRSALEVLTETGEDALFTARVRLELAYALIAADQPEAARSELEFAEMDARASGAVALVARAVGSLGSLDELDGARDLARSRFDEASELAALAGDADGCERWLAALKGAFDPA